MASKLPTEADLKKLDDAAKKSEQSLAASEKELEEELKKIEALEKNIGKID